MATVKKLLSIAGILLVGLLLALGGGALWLRKVYPPERLRGMAAEKLGERLGRRVEIAEARLGLRHGLELIGIRVSEKPDFSAGVFAEASEFRVAPRLRPLLQRRLVFRSAEISGLRLRLVRDAQGLLNIADLVSTENHGGVEHSVPGARGDAAAFLFSEAALHDGEVLYEDWVRQVEIRLSGLEGQAEDIAPFRPVRFKLSGETRLRTATATWTVDFTADTRVSFADGGRLELINLETRSNRSQMTIKGWVTGFFEEPSADLALKAAPLFPTEIFPFVDIPVPLRTLRLTLDSRVRASTGSFAVDGQVNAVCGAPPAKGGDGDAGGPGIGLLGNFSADAHPSAKGWAWTARLEPTKVHLKDPAFAPALSLEGTWGGMLTVSGVGSDWSATWDMDGRAGSVSYGGWLEKAPGSSLAVVGRTRPRFETRLETDDLLLKPGGPWPETLSLRGPLAVHARLSGTAEDLEFDLSMNADRLMAERGGTLKKTAGRPLALAATGRLLSRRDLRFSAFRLESDAGALTARGRLQAPWTLASLEGSANGLLNLENLSRWLPALASCAPQGSAGVSATARGASDNRRLEGTIALQRVTVSPLPGVVLSDLKGGIVITPHSVRLDDLRGTAFGSPFRLEGKMDGFSRPTLTLDGHWSRLEADKMLSVFRSTGPAAPGAGRTKKSAPIALTRGTFRVDEITHPHYVGRGFVFGWDLTEVGRDLSVVSGTATVTAASGEIRDLPVARKVNKLMGKDASRMTYRKLSATFTAENGLARTNDFTLDSDQTDFLARGHVNLVNRLADLTLVLKLPPGSVRGSLGQWITAEDGRPTLDAHLTGPLSDPQVKKGEFLRKTGSRAVQDILKKTLGGWKGKKE